MKGLIETDAPLIRPYSDDEAWQRTDGGLIVPRVHREPRKIRAVDLFCGCGGFSLGMQQAGLDVIGAVEWEPNAIVTYLANLGSVDGCAVAYVDEEAKRHFTKTLKKLGESQSSKWIGRHNQDRDGSGCRAMVVGDASKVTGDLVRETLDAIGIRTPIDVVFGGPPCQGMSSAGKERPDDPRNNLVLEFVRIADELGAEVFCMENVPPLITQGKFRPLFNALIERAHKAGFTVTANVLDAAGYGVPQRRRRAFVVGTRGQANAKQFAFAMPTHHAFIAEPGGKRISFLDGFDAEERAQARTRKARKRKKSRR